MHVCPMSFDVFGFEIVLLEQIFVSLSFLQAAGGSKVEHPAKPEETCSVTSFDFVVS